jgi:hypothetical protein
MIQDLTHYDDPSMTPQGNRSLRATMNASLRFPIPAKYARLYGLC